LDLDDSKKESLLVKSPSVPAPAAMTQSDLRPNAPTLTPLDPIILETEGLQHQKLRKLNSDIFY
jgi:hypothetical protein